jgi:hypothetical protein
MRQNQPRLLLPDGPSLRRTACAMLCTYAQAAPGLILLPHESCPAQINTRPGAAWAYVHQMHLVVRAMLLLDRLGP